MHDTLTDKIIGKLSTGTKNVSALIHALSQEEKVTIQGIYKALRGLREKEIIVMHNKSVSLALAWLNSEKERISTIEHTYEQERSLEKLVRQNGGKLLFHFHTLNELDLFWTHAYLLLLQSVDDSAISYSIQPHDWYYYARQSTDTLWVSRHKGKERLSRIILTHASTLDKHVLSERRTKQRPPLEFLYANPLKQPEHIYYNVMEDYVFKVTLDKSIAELLNNFIKTHSALPLVKSSLTLLGSILTSKSKHTLSIVKSKKSADNLRKRVDHYFE
jgi:hypothetical protein